MLYTRKGDNGTTGKFGCNQKISKSSIIIEALGALDETNSFLGICKANKEAVGYEVLGFSFAKVIHDIQNNLFIIQAEVAGSEKNISEEKIKEIEKIIGEIEKELPEIKTFFISGTTEMSAHFDTARTIARRAERRVVEVSEENKVKIGRNSLAYLNRLSSLLYALARLSAHKSGIKESTPDYK